MLCKNACGTKDKMSMGTEYNFKLGFTFILTAVIFWGMLPIALKLSSDFIDPVTLTWFRFLVAFSISILLQGVSGNLYQFRQLHKKDWLMLTLAALFSLTNYITFVYCLDYLQPGPAQLNFQTAPFFLAFGGMLFFKEKLNAIQMACFATLALGMLLFFHPYLIISSEGQSKQWLGVLLVQFSALSWACYALIQKKLISKLSPGNVLLYIYASGLILLMPFSEFDAFAKMQPNQWIIAVFCAVNTLIAYGSFAQAMRYWPTAQVGASVALTPIFSFSFTVLVVTLGWWPQKIMANALHSSALFGIILVVGSVLTVQLMPAIRNRKLKAALSNG